jgi:hypothetical protein
MRDFPGIVPGVKAQRKFLQKAVTYLAADVGIRQFLDIGTGIPGANNTHEVAQAVAPECRIVYVDNDPIVLAHARALLTGRPEGSTAYLDADLRDPGTILREAAQTLDLSRPVAIMMIGILHMITDSDHPHEIVAELLGAVPSGSWLAIAHPASDVIEQNVQAVKRLNQSLATPTTMRTHAQVEQFFDGTSVIPPGIVQMHRWDPAGLLDAAGPMPAYCGLGRKL